MSSNFDFHSIVDRRASNSIKWHLYPEEVLPMWVADMDFKSPQPVLDALHTRVEHGVFGYEWPRKPFLEVLCNWCKRMYGWDVKPDDIVELPGLVSGLNAVSRAFGPMGDAAITLTPVYPPFLSAPTNQGMTVTQVPMKQVMDTEHTFHYEVDFETFEKAITPRTALFILCHPHNPAGIEYTPDVLRKLGEICLKHNVLMCSDEIHCDLMLGNTKHTPMATLSPEIAANTITLMAPSKTFNLPGLGFSFAIIQNEKLRNRFKNASGGIIPHTNVLGMVAAEAAYTHCDDWLVALRGYLTENRNTVNDFMAENLPEIKLSTPNSTYLMWMDCRKLDTRGQNPYDFFLKEAKVALNNGPLFGTAGEGFARLNFGAPRELVLQGLERMRKAVRNS